MNRDQYLAPRSTSRLFIEKLHPDDIKLWTKFFDSSDATTYLHDTDNKSSAERACMMIERQFLRYKENKYGLMKLINKHNKDFIGLCGLLTQIIDNTEELEI